VRCAALGGEHGIVRITRGASAGSQFAVRNASIGKQEADIIITDAVVSRRHARLDVSGGVARLWDEQSTNGTFVQRGGQTWELHGDACSLEHGDTIFLGSPQRSTAVTLVYELKREV
jgi:pSer/pThr/pTyr-binding forkhead associated (FHA) protein